jgi:hypothetical protein
VVFLGFPSDFVGDLFIVGIVDLLALVWKKKYNGLINLSGKIIEYHNNKIK